MNKEKISKDELKIISELVDDETYKLQGVVKAISDPQAQKTLHSLEAIQSKLKSTDLNY